MRRRRGDVLFAALAATFVTAALAAPAAALARRRFNSSGVNWNM